MKVPDESMKEHAQGVQSLVVTASKAAVRIVQAALGSDVPNPPSGALHVWIDAQVAMQNTVSPDDFFDNWQETQAPEKFAGEACTPFS